MEEFIKPITDALLLKSGSSTSLAIEKVFPDGRLIGGKYNTDSHTVTIYIEVIKKQCLQIFQSLEYFPDYLKAVLAHEIGHAEDGDLPMLADKLEDPNLTEQGRKQIALQIEENAWHYAVKLIPEIDQGFLQTIIYYSLKEYKDDLLMPGA
ncbi:hypothetical protein [Metabacillus sp. RGM 3146]|uniref:hypothetical protein n=1 Tax=Metabacillus sp. RGM 3146 TaxID=3401092 RepID=UPI003B9C32AE